MIPTDVLDPAPDLCMACGCRISEQRPGADCHHPAECDCHAEWRTSTDELEKRWLWGDR